MNSFISKLDVRYKVSNRHDQHTTDHYYRIYFVQGTHNFSKIISYSEGAARRAFHDMFNGESIIGLSDCLGNVYQEFRGLGI